MLQMVDGALQQSGVDTESHRKRGALVFSSDRGHLDGGSFNPQAMVDGLCDQIDNAVRDGFTGLCATGDMKWELGPAENFDLLMEYEAILEKVFHQKPLMGICQYHRDTIPARTLREALASHRSAYIGDTFNRDNVFYMPPEVFENSPGKESSQKQGEWMCEQILRVMKAEQARDRALFALEAVNRDLERRVKERTAELEMVNQQLEAFSYSVSHDLRAPLRTIKGFSEILADEAGPVLNAETSRYLENVRTSAARMDELIVGLLEMSRMVKSEMTRQAVDLSALAIDVEHDLRAAAPERSVEFVVDENLHATGDRVLLRCVLANLVGNAWKFTAKTPGARVEVGKLSPEPEGPVFFVKDNGAGFEMRRADKLFSPFQRLHQQEDFPGTGVGLATVQRIVNKHNGRIWTKSQLGQGATFFFTLGNGAKTQ